MQTITVKLAYRDTSTRAIVKRLGFHWDPKHKIWCKPAAYYTESDRYTLRGCGVYPRTVMLDPQTINDIDIDAMVDRLL